ncbi:MAG TPA: helix-turn-helix domain-containing protein [Candidatus Paceibacterota bacterium]|nr:helix-turn-helix domain-containing protein [Candidatus Paceibacterota bacterium]
MINNFMFGEFLSQKIEEKNFGVEDLARLAGIPEHYLRALLEENFAHLPANVFVRGYLKKIASIIEVDEEDLWQLYLKEYNNIMPPQVDMLPTNRFESKGKTISEILRALRYVPIWAIIITAIGFILFQGKNLFGEPRLQVNSPVFENIETSENPFILEGEGQPHSYILINGKEIYLSDDGKFSEPIQLKPGLNKIIVEASNRLGKKKTITRNIYFEPPNTAPPTSPKPTE